MKKPHINPC